jgi:hypothetical protein
MVGWKLLLLGKLTALIEGSDRADSVQVPMVAPFFGTTFGGFLYDLFIYTGESPINNPWMGMRRVGRPTKAQLSNSVA